MGLSDSRAGSAPVQAGTQARLSSVAASTRTSPLRQRGGFYHDTFPARRSRPADIATRPGAPSAGPDDWLPLPGLAPTSSPTVESSPSPQSAVAHRSGLL